MSWYNDMQDRHDTLGYDPDRKPLRTRLTTQEITDHLLFNKIVREQRIVRAIEAAAESLCPVSVEIVGLKTLLFNLVKSPNSFNLHTFAGQVRHEFSKGK